MKDSKFNLTKALPNANANNNTTSIDLLTEDVFDDKWRRGYFQVDVPALSDHTNTSVTNLITLQHSSDNSNFASTDPVIAINVVGVASTGSVARSVKVPMPPGIKRYVRFNQLVPTNGGIGNNAVVNYDLVT